MDRAKVKAEYKQSPPAAGVFVIRNKKNGKILVGRSTNVEGLLNRHRFDLRMRSHRNRELQADWLEGGEGDFEFEVVERVDPKDDKIVDLDEELRVLEELWLEKLRPHGESGYHRLAKTD